MSVLTAIKGKLTRLTFDRHKGFEAVLEFVGSMKRRPKGFDEECYPEGVVLRIDKRFFNVEEARALAAFIQDMVGEEKARPAAAAVTVVPEGPQPNLCPGCGHQRHTEPLPSCNLMGCNCTEDHREAAAEAA